MDETAAKLEKNMRSVNIKPLVSPVIAAALAVGLTACGSSSEPEPPPTAEELAEMAKMECEEESGRVESDGSCTSAEDIAAEELAERIAEQTGALETASEAVTTALGTLGGTPDQATINAAMDAVAALSAAIDAAVDVPDAEKAGYVAQHGSAYASVTSAQSALNAAKNAEELAKAAAMAAKAAKLYVGIKAPSGEIDGTPAATDFAAGYDTADTAILVRIGDADPAVTDNVTLSEDKKTSVAANHGWTGKRYIDKAGGDSYEAIVYSNVAAPTAGDKFGQVGVTSPADGYEYGLEASGETAATFTFAPNRVASSRFDHTAGNKPFKLPANTVRVVILGSYHGVSGSYYCVPGGATCAVQVAADGFTLGSVDDSNAFTAGGGTWTFKPTNPESRVTELADTMYASYGWWLKKTENDSAYTASAFADNKGTVPPAAGLNALNGTATYTGGAAGQYALSSSTGGINDAGDFTARARLEADFTNNETATAISGTIDNFIGADGTSRNWEVELSPSAIGDTGAIGSDTTTTVTTVWTIGDDAAKAAGSWTGMLRNNGTDSVPQVATGTFYSEHNNAGRMVGGFGATKDD